MTTSTRNLITPPAQAIAHAREAQGYNVIRFPSNHYGAHGLVFNFKKFQYTDSPNIDGISPSYGSIIMPLSRTLQENISPNTSQDTLDLMGKATAELAGRGVKMRGFEDILNTARDTGQGVGSTLKTLVGSAPTTEDVGAFFNYILRTVGSSVSNSVKSGLSQATGTALNPHNTMVFTGMNLKNYTFEWNLLPENERDSENLNKLIHRFRNATLPRYRSVIGQGNLGSDIIDRGLLEYPDLVDIFFIGMDTEHFPMFKSCMITQFNVDYTIQNGHSLLKGENGSRPAGVQINLQVYETDIHTKDDYPAYQMTGN